MVVPLTFDYTFRPFLPELARFESTRELESSKLYRKLKPDIDRVLTHVWHEQLAVTNPKANNSIQTVAWNIERGIRLRGIIQSLQEHPLLANADILLLSELDCGMARTENRFVAREIASALGMNYAFAPCYLALTKGAGLEKQTGGDNRESLHGNAILSRFSMQRVHSLGLPNGKD